MSDEITPIEDDWHTWSDPELMGRLLRRGIEPVMAKGWVRDRLMPDAEAEIEATLQAQYFGRDDEPVKLEISLDRRARR